MKKFPNPVTQRRLSSYLLGIILFLLINNACQPVQAPLSPTAFQTLPTVTSTSTETIVVPSPTVILSPTVVVQPIATVVPLPLSQKGPWLVYRKPHQVWEYVEYEYFIVNEDGTGKEGLVSDDDPGEIKESPFNHLVFFPGKIYLFKSAQMNWTLVYDGGRECWGDNGCFYTNNTAYTGSKEKGLLAIMTRRTEAEIPELLIYELPGGKLRDRFPLLFQCPADDESCDTSKIEWWNFEMAWSPNGQYLAFAAALENQENQSSDLYLYDTQTGNVLRLTRGPDSVAQIAWSPDGQWIIMGELHESPYPYTTSLWAVSATNNEMRRLYSLEGGWPQRILEWLDDRRFITYGGISLINPFDLPAQGFKLVDMNTGKVTTLFKGIFASVDLDKEHETLAIRVWDPEGNEGYEGTGTYLVSTSNPKLRYVGPLELWPHWNDEFKLFVTEESCENDPQGNRAFDYKGEWQCVHLSWPDSFPSPDGQWQISVQDGTWLKAKGKQPVRITQGDATQAIWRPDSQGFFLVEEAVLYYISLPQAIPVVVDQCERKYQIEYQWLDGD